MPSLSFTLSTAAALTASLVAAQSTTSSGSGSTFTPLVRKRFNYDNLPYKADPNGGVRGTQYGYNRCNATTEGQESLCQTATINSIDDFCLWGPPEPNSLIGDTEGEAVAWCTKPGRGTRLIPQGALTGVQFLRAPAYVQVVGLIDQTMINIAEGDYGGEMDPHGADQRGNPLGGLIFSQAFSNSTNTGNSSSQAWRQVIQWHNFMGANVFCLKACDPDNADGYRYCEHIYDRIGCHYNAPAAYREGVFQSCESDNMLFPGYYVGDNGQTTIYTQPPESLGVISTVPYEPVTPASSQCTNYTSASLYTDLPAAAGNATSSVVSSSAVVTSTPAAAVRPVNNNAAAAAPNASPTSAAGSTKVLSGAVAGLVAVAAALVAFA